MAIQIPNPGTGNGATGDNEFVLWSKVKDNFSDQTNAASRLVGTASGNVMEVGAFGWGSDAKKADYFNFANEAPTSELKKTQMVFNVNDGSLGYGQGFAWSVGERHYSIVGSLISNQVFVTMLDNNAAAPSSPERGYKKGTLVIEGINATRDSNGFLRDSNSIAEAVVADATGNVAVSSIQAGIGAPKIAYKKLTGTFHNNGGRTLIPHGLDVSKILDVSVFVSIGTERFPPNYSDTTAAVTYKAYPDITNIKIDDVNSSLLYNKPLTILITYEV